MLMIILLFSFTSDSVQDLEAQSLDGVQLRPLYSAVWCQFLQRGLALLHQLTSSASFQKETRCSNLSSSSNTQCPPLSSPVRPSNLLFIQVYYFKTLLRNAINFSSLQSNVLRFLMLRRIFPDFFWLSDQKWNLTKVERLFSAHKPARRQMQHKMTGFS